MRTFNLSILPILLVILGFTAGCGGSSIATGTTASTGSSSGSNSIGIAVNGGPEANVVNGYIYENGAFASATICVPGGTSDCVTIGNLLVDTGSTGLRVFDSEVSGLDLPVVDASNGSPAYDCVSFVDGSYLWGTVEQANVTLGAETASNVPIEVISGSDSAVPSSCSNGGTSVDTAYSLGANGLLGVGSEPTDCFLEGADYCSSGTPPTGAYYTCSGDTCNPALIAQANQVANPVALFPADNNGVIVELPAASGPEASMTGSLVFGIGTESNNALPSSDTVFTLACDLFATEFNGTTFVPNNDCTGGSFIDSGSNALYFADVGNIVQECSSNLDDGAFAGLYCPNSTQSLSATNEGANGASLATSFSVGNAEDLLLGSTASDAVMPTFAGTNPTGFGFDWGLPFFYGNNVYVSIDGQKMPSGAPAAPWWAY